jgi:hypothetical protein
MALKIVSANVLLMMICMGIHLPYLAEAFSVSPTPVIMSRAALVCLEAVKGMGMAKTADKKKQKKGTSNGFSSSSNSDVKATTFDVKASILRLDKKYDDLMLASAKTMHYNDDDDDDDDDDASDDSVDHSSNMVTSEYVVAVRSTCLTAVADWVPVAQLVLGRPLLLAKTSASDGASDPTTHAAVSVYCRELSHVASQGSRIFQSVPRTQLEYSVESTDSFYKHVYDVVVKGKNDDAGNDQVMTKAEARKFLNLDPDCTDVY